jgi:DNA-binding MarR family transcriptional regulator
MTTAPTDPLVDALATRLRRLDLIGWQRVTAWAGQADLSFEDLRLLLALALKADDGSASVTELAELAGLPLDVAYPTTHRLRGRGYVSEDQRRYSLSPQGEELTAMLETTRREGIQTYVDGLGPDERQRLRDALTE